MMRPFDGRFIHFQFERALTLGTEIQGTSLNSSQKQIESESHTLLSTHLLEIPFQNVCIVDSNGTSSSRTVTNFVTK